MLSLGAARNSHPQELSTAEALPAPAREVPWLGMTGNDRELWARNNTSTLLVNFLSSSASLRLPPESPRTNTGSDDSKLCTLTHSDTGLAWPFILSKTHLLSPSFVLWTRGGTRNSRGMRGFPNMGNCSTSESHPGAPGGSRAWQVHPGGFHRGGEGAEST